MPIQDLTDTSERLAWYDHPLTKELRNELAERVDEILNNWTIGGYIVPNNPEASNALNMTGLANYQILESFSAYIKLLSKEERTEEEDSNEPAPY